ncbi:non-ribosomal peptide synthase [Aspergillus sp. HF37]|nr:non-ribosomal peptide synthase [Aspergillus sp. HF37]
MPSPSHVTTLLGHFFAQARDHPSSIAVEDGTQSADPGIWPSITYGQLDALSDAWSERLRLAGVRAGSIVPLLSTKSVSMVAAVLAILKLRAAYVPIDVDSWGKDRIATVLNALDPEITVSTPPRSSEWHTDYLQLVLADAEPADMEPGSADPGHDRCAGRGDDLAYIIFTSGTEGKPKGVMVGQRSISRYVTEGGKLPFNFNTRHGTRVLLICSIAFDACSGAMFSTLCNGGTLVLAHPATLEAVAKTCHVLPLTPTILATLDPTSGFDSVERIFVGGESPSPSLVSSWSSSKRRLYNSYGPTETTCMALMAELLPGCPITIGWPISYSSVILLGEDGRECDEGEICIAGLGLAVGYFRNPDRTDRAFATRHGARIYRTGDYGKRTKWGVKFCGRRDRTVKNRGFLISLEADVEPALLSYDEVKRASALMHQNKLIAFVTPVAAKIGLREYLSRTASAFLVPDAIYSLDEFPTTPNGKADRERLVQVHEEAQGEHACRLETGLSPMDAIRRALSHVLRLSESHILECSSFRDLGGHSLAAVMLVAAMRQMGYGIGVAEIMLLDRVDKLAASTKKSADVLLRTSANDRGWLEHLKQEIAVAKSLRNEHIAPMTDMQARLVAASIATPGLSFIKASFTFEHPRASNPLPVLRAAWGRLREHHAILRTSFFLNASHGAQVISQDPGFAWREIHVPDSEWEAACQREELLDVSGICGINPEDERSISRVVLVSSASSRTRFIWTVHHALVDGWSMATLLRDFSACIENKPLPQSPPFSLVAQNIAQLERESPGRAAEFWKRYLDGYVPAQRLRVPPPLDTNDYTQAAQAHKMAVRTSSVESAARDFDVTPATILYAAWSLVVSRYCGSDRISLGAVLSGRSLQIPGVENVVGPMINTVPLPVNVHEAQTAREYVRSVFGKLCEVLEFQWSPVRTIQESAGCKPADLFDTLLALQYDFPQPSWQAEKVPAPGDLRYDEVTQVPLSVLLDSSDGRFDARFVYRRAYFSDAVVQRMVTHFENLLAALVAAAPDCPLEQVIGQMLSEPEHRTLTAAPRQPLQLSSVPENVADAVENMIQTNPNANAVEACMTSITYREFGEMTEQIAYHLEQITPPGGVVCVVSDGSLPWLVGMIAVINIGAIYCPIDQGLPMERKKYMTGNCEPSLVLYSNTGQEKVPCSARYLVIESALRQPPYGPASAATNYRCRPAGDDIACLIYTSGSTGVPKAVQLKHKGIMNVISQPGGRLHARPGQRIAQMLSLGFDCCIKEVFSTLCFGATLVVKNPENPLAHLSMVDATMATPSLLAALEPDDYPNLMSITVAGEPVSQALNDNWANGWTLVNGYGPAECTLVALTASLRPGERVSIGRPVPGMSCYLLDSKRRPVPAGVSGEIYLSGVQVTPGYLRNEDESVKRFLADPFYPGRLMFRTGDIGRSLESGKIEYIGREDNQIKLRGFRIELGEVQSVISRAAPTARSVALVIENGNLIAFVTPKSVDIEHLASNLKSALPHHAIPSRVIALPTLPTSANGKVDSVALKRYHVEQKRSLNPELGTEFQRIIAAIWANALGRDLESVAFSPNDRFFELGGHSLLQIKVAQAISRHWNIRPLPLDQVIRHDSLQELSGAIERLAEDRTSLAPTGIFLDMAPVRRGEQLPVSYLEKEMLINHVVSGKSPAGNMNFVCKIQGDINIEALAIAIRRVTAGTEVFQSRYHVSARTISRTLAQEAPEIPRLVRTGNPSSFASEFVTKPFELDAEPPVGVSIITGAADHQPMVVVVMSHVVGDATTMATFLNQVSKTYARQISSLKHDATIYSETASNRLSYIDWAQWIETSQPSSTNLSFWSSYLCNMPEPLSFGKPEPEAAMYTGFTQSWSLSPSRLHEISHLAARASVTRHQVVLAAVFFCLQCVDRRDDVLLGAPFTHRTEPGTECMPGLFLDRLPIRLQRANRRGRMDGQETLFEFLAAVHESSQQALAHAIPFQEIAKLLNHRPSLSHPLFKVMVTYHTAADTRPLLEIKGADVRSIPYRNIGGSKFPLSVEFTETALGDLQVDMEHDAGCITENTAQRLEFALSFALQLMTLEINPGDIIRLGVEAFCSSSATRADSSRPMRPDGEQENGIMDRGRENMAHPSAQLKDAIDVVLDATCKCLDLDKGVVDGNASFWQFGAQSADALILQKLCEERGLKVSLRDVFMSRSIGDLAALAVAT